MMFGVTASGHIRLAGTWSAVLLGGLLAGVGDTLLAVGMHRISPVVVYQAVAAGLLGRESFRGGLATAALGMLLHFLIATIAAAAYVGAGTRLRLLRQGGCPAAWRSGLPCTSS